MAKREFQIQSVRVVIGLLRNFQESKKFPFLNCATPFENPQRWMGQNTFPILLLNDDNMIGEHQKTRMKMLYGCPFEKNEKEVFFRLTTFFSGTKKFCSRNNFCSVFYVLLCKKKFRSDPKKIFLKKNLEILEKNKISKIFGSLRNFFFAQ